MADIVRWNPYDEIMRLREEVNRFFGPMQYPARDGFFSPGSPLLIPSVDVRETGTHVIVTAEIPGVEPADLDIVVTEDHMLLKGETKQENKIDGTGGYHRMERRYGTFQRVIPFPAPVRHKEAKAEYRNGLVEVSVPKSDHETGKATRLRLSETDKKNMM